MKLKKVCWKLATKVLGKSGTVVEAMMGSLKGAILTVDGSDMAEGTLLLYKDHNRMGYYCSEDFRKVNV